MGDPVAELEEDMRVGMTAHWARVILVGGQKGARRREGVKKNLA